MKEGKHTQRWEDLLGHQFLCDSWFDEIKKLRDAADIPVPDVIKDLVINVEVNGGPDGQVTAHMQGGRFEKGLAEGAPTKLKIPYDIAKKMVVEGDQNAATQAFMSGQIQVEGDMTKIMAMGAAGPPGEAQKALETQIRAMTE
jgi:putative sterol carrier protein